MPVISMSERLAGWRTVMGMITFRGEKKDTFLWEKKKKPPKLLQDTRLPSGNKTINI